MTEALIEKELILSNQKYFLWRLNPVTGRSHQLRYEMHRHQVPIIGDRLYGSSLNLPEFLNPDEIALKAVEIKLPANANKWGLAQSYQLSWGLGSVT